MFRNGLKQTQTYGKFYRTKVDTTKTPECPDSGHLT